MAYYPPPFYPHTQEWSFSQTPQSTSPPNSGPVKGHTNQGLAGSPRVKPGRTISGLSAGSGSGKSGRNWGLGIKTHGFLNGAHTDEPQSGIPPQGGNSSSNHPNVNGNHARQSERSTEQQTYSLNDSPRSFKDYLIPPISAHPHLPASHIHNLNHQPSSIHSHYGLGNGTYASSPVQASPSTHHAQPQPHPLGESGSAHPPPKSDEVDKKPRPRRGILLPAHYHLTPGSVQAAEWARKFGRFGFEGEVVLRCGGGGGSGNAAGGNGGRGEGGSVGGAVGNARGVGGSASGWGIWVVDKWSVTLSVNSVLLVEEADTTLVCFNGLLFDCCQIINVKRYLVISYAKRRHAYR